MSETEEVQLAPKLSPDASKSGQTTVKGGYIPDYKKNEGSIMVIVVGFVVCVICIILAFKLKVSKDKVIFANEAKLVGIAKSEEIKQSRPAYARIATDYAGYVYTRGPEGITRAEMLPLICTDECRQRILEKDTGTLKAKQLAQTLLIRSVDVVKVFKSGMEVKLEGVLRQSSVVTTGKSVPPTTEMNVVIYETLEYSSRPLEAGQYPFLLTDCSIEVID